MKLKKFCALVLCGVMCPSLVSATYGLDARGVPSDPAFNPGGISIVTSAADRDAQFEAILGGILPESVARGPKYHYKTEYFPYQYETLSGYAGNQVAGGYRFSTGGGFWFSDSGGPTVSGSISLSLPAPYNFISFSINLGQKGSSGVWVSAPNTTDYFKLYVSKVMELRPFAVYRAPSGTEDWELDHSGTVSIVYSVDQYAVKVG